MLREVQTSEGHGVRHAKKGPPHDGTLAQVKARATAGTVENRQVVGRLVTGPPAQGCPLAWRDALGSDNWRFSDSQRGRDSILAI